MQAKRSNDALASTSAQPHTQPCSETLSGQVVLVFQGGGALGAYQAGVYQAMHEAGIEPDWVIGTSIGAINAALIVGNPPALRLPRLKQFWRMVQSEPDGLDLGLAAIRTANIIAGGIPGFFVPNPQAWLGTQVPVGPDEAAYYSTAPLRATLHAMTDAALLSSGPVRLTVGAVNVARGVIRYFDTEKPESGQGPIGVEHILASGALPPAFPAIEIDHEWYWDGGIYSNTPIEAVTRDYPRRDSVIFAAMVWQETGPVPVSIAQAQSRAKDIQFASRTDSHITKEMELHRLRHVIGELTKNISHDILMTPEVRDLSSYGCHTVMHMLQLCAPPLDGEDQNKDIDFSEAGINARWQAGYEDTKAMITDAPWEEPTDQLAGVIVHRRSLAPAPAGH